MKLRVPVATSLVPKQAKPSPSESVNLTPFTVSYQQEPRPPPDWEGGHDQPLITTLLLGSWASSVITIVSAYTVWAMGPGNALNISDIV